MYLYISIATLILLIACNHESQEKVTHKSAIASKSSSWYPKNREGLNSNLDQLINSSTPKKHDRPIAIIVPHAGLIYSGKTAAKGFASTIGQSYKRIIIIGPSHYSRVVNELHVPRAQTYKTPLGNMEIDRDFIKKLAVNNHFIVKDALFSREHSVDNEIPFIQKIHPNSKIVPIIMGHFDKRSIFNVANFLKPLLDNQTLLVISSDFTHFGPNYQYTPFNKNIKSNISTLDNKSALIIKKKIFENFWSHIKDEGKTICGQMPIALFLALLPKKHTTVHLVDYKTSGELLDNFTNSVSYMALSITGAWKMDKTTPTFELTTEEKSSLLLYSKKVLEAYIKTKIKIEPKDSGIQFTDNLKQVAGGFVTLHKNNNLRGCIGEILPQRDILTVVRDRTIDAAIHDPRFPPVTENELKDIDIEISILTPPIAIESYKEIIIGKHGVILEKNGKSAVFLPQVATEQGWNVETTLTQLSMKAGLTGTDWQTDTKFSVFEAIVMSEAH